MQGGLRSVGLIEDACLVALVETGVPVWALDADAVDPGGLGIRTAAHDERAASDQVVLEPGTLVVADATKIYALLFAEPLRGHGIGARTQRVALFALAVDGVPAIHVEEALWICAELLG